MLESIEIFIDMNSHSLRAHDMIENFAAYNYESIEFTVHVENKSLRLRLLNTNSSSLYDGALAVENYCKSITKLLSKRDVKFTVIEHLSMSETLKECQSSMQDQF